MKVAGEIFIYGLLALFSLCTFTTHATAQHLKIPKERLQMIDGHSGQQVREVLILPLYSSHEGIFVPPEGPTTAIAHHYLDHPFIYQSGEPLNIYQPRLFTGLPLIFAYVGKVVDLNGILVVAPGYRPLWTDDLWDPRPDQRKVTLAPITTDEWSKILLELTTLAKDDRLIRAPRQLWNLPFESNVRVKYDKKERELIRTFLQKRNSTDVQ